MHIRTRCAILMGCVLGCGVARVDAGSAIEMQLARLQRVSLRVATNLHYEPLPGLDVKKLKEALAERSGAALLKGGVSVDDSARQRLYVDVTRPVRTAETDRVLIRVNLSLIEPARLERETPTAASEPGSQVVSWQSDRFEFCDIDEIAGVSMQLAEEAVGEFLAEVEKATRWANEPAAR